MRLLEYRPRSPETLAVHSPATGASVYTDTCWGLTETAGTVELGVEWRRGLGTHKGHKHHRNGSGKGCEW